MFSTQEVQQLFEAWSPKTHENLPQLAASTDGRGIVSANKLAQEFDHLTIEAKERQPLVQFSQILGVDGSIVAQLVNANPQSALLSHDELTIVPRSQRTHICARLQELLPQALVEVDAFAREYDVSKSSLTKLVRSIDDSSLEINNCILSPKYESLLAECFKSRLESSIQNLEPTVLQSDNLEGHPPRWLIERVFQIVQHDLELIERFYVTQTADGVVCTPKEAIVRDRDKTLEGLKSGELSFLDLHDFAQEYRQLYESSEIDPVALSNDTDSVVIPPNTLVSVKWLTQVVAQASDEVNRNGFVNCAGLIPVDVPESLRDGLQDRVIKDLTESPASDLMQIQHFIVTPAKYSTARETVSDFAKVQAAEKWEAAKDTPDKDLRLQPPEIVAIIPPDDALLGVVANDVAVQGSLSDRFLQEIATLESQNETEFAKLWKERVMSRARIYQQGLDAIEDQKLQGQLSELLANYLQKDLLPDAIAKAGAQGTTRSKKTRKNIQKLETALAGDSKDLPAVLSSLERFAKKQDIQSPDESMVNEAKSNMVIDMVRRMQKPKIDGPLLFLTFVLVIFAKHNPGIVYATGKFAPKLLKQLKSKMSVEDYERAEGWKEAAKAGTLRAEEKEAMRRMTNMD